MRHPSLTIGINIAMSYNSGNNLIGSYIPYRRRYLPTAGSKKSPTYKFSPHSTIKFTTELKEIYYILREPLNVHTFSLHIHILFHYMYIPPFTTCTYPSTRSSGHRNRCSDIIFITTRTRSSSSNLFTYPPFILSHRRHGSCTPSSE